ncbi:hypothetical protein JNB71_15740 [Rhizobium herbae]|uniref:Uncharacterized protein n=1 Tax=Rhizobium herbae TaxID=508661 RepID=A0ABS7HC24_9HYPH|nr:hypothetical protein [Rhizobium herbae]MBW9064766.1 hypothetical protein [Rhizobium herbae]
MIIKLRKDAISMHLYHLSSSVPPPWREAGITLDAAREGPPLHTISFE